MKKLTQLEITQDLLFYHPAATIHIVDEKIYLNLKAQEITGYSNSEFESVDDWFKIVYEDQYTFVKNIYLQAKAANFPKTDRVFFKTKQNKMRVFDFTAKVTNQIEIWHLHDVTESILLEERYSVLFNHSLIPHLLFDEAGLVDCNEATLKILKASSKSELLSKKLSQFSPLLQPTGLTSADVEIKMQDLARENGVHRYEWTNCRLNGEEFLTEVNLSVIEVAAKKMLLVAWHDLTEIKLAQAKLMNTLKMATLGEMSAYMAHEINNPLAIIMGRSELAKRKAAQAESVDLKLIQDLEKINSSSERIAKIIKALRAFSRDGHNEKLVTSNLQNDISECFEICREKLAAKNIDLSINFENDFLVKSRQNEVTQIFMNLINNSVEALQNCSEKWIQINMAESPLGVRIEVIDSGPEISKHILENMMKPFFTTKQEGQGIGLGLSISKGIIESYSGHFYYEKIKNHNAFVIELPAQKIEPLKVAN